MVFGDWPMLFAMLDLADFLIIATIVAVLAGGATAGASFFRAADRDRLRRVEEKLDLVLGDLGVDYHAPERDDWQELANDPGRKIAAIKAFREKYGVGLAEAKRAVEAYIAGEGRG